MALKAPGLAMRRLLVSLSLACCIFGPAEAAPQWDTVKALFEAESLGDAQRRAVLSGKSTDGMADAGPVVCACFGVGLNVIRGALDSGAAANVEEIGKEANFRSVQTIVTAFGHEKKSVATVDALAREQEQTAEKATKGPATMEALLHSGDTWDVAGDAEAV